MFADAAARLAGVAGAVLGWRPDEFWRATPEELGAILAALVPEAEAGAPLDRAMMASMQEMFPVG
jgi:uncharacterized phage protein (TIGR02216 family)